MRIALRFTLLCSVMALVGFGCEVPPYIPAPEMNQREVAPSQVGAQASTGGMSATVTGNLPTEKLVAALPKEGGGWSGGEIAELRNPIPLPDGTRAEYVGVTREYLGEGTMSVQVTITDTRGIPALTAFLQGYDARQDDAGYRSRIPVGDVTGWMAYTYGPNREDDGTGSLILLYRERFLVQLDGSSGVAAETIARLAERMDERQFE